jgi:hypothetical protein
MKSTWVFYRYVMLDENDEVIAPSGHADILESVKGAGAPYRVREPSLADAKNFLMQLRQEQVDGEQCAIFVVGHTVDVRVEHRYDPKSDRIQLEEVDADDMRFTNAIMAPRLRIVAVKQGSGDRLPANSGIGRLRAIIEWNSKNALDYERTASHDDVVQAMKKLNLEEFSFDVRPFNPHPSLPGDQLHELMKKAKAGRLSGKAYPMPGGGMKNDPDGLVSEAVGLSEKGYGQFGIKGRTDSGAELTYQKHKMRGQTDKDIDLQEKPTNLRISVPVDDGVATEHEYVVKTMKELFDG